MNEFELVLNPHTAHSPSQRVHHGGRSVSKSVVAILSGDLCPSDGVKACSWCEELVQTIESTTGFGPVGYGEPEKQATYGTMHIREALGLLNSMILSGESHSSQSRRIFATAKDALYVLEKAAPENTKPTPTATPDDFERVLCMLERCADPCDIRDVVMSLREKAFPPVLTVPEKDSEVVEDLHYVPSEEEMRNTMFRAMTKMCQFLDQKIRI